MNEQTNGTGGIPEYARSQSSAYNITEKESLKLQKEYEINNLLWNLYKAAGIVGENMTIRFAINELEKQTRFANEVKQQYYVNNVRLLIESSEETQKHDDVEEIPTGDGSIVFLRHKKREFKPFEKVLVRDIDSIWSAAYYSHYEKEEDKHSCGGVLFDECIPYEGNEHLLGTSDNPE